MFLGLVSQADDAGRLLDSPRYLNGLLFPHTDDDCTESLAILAELGAIDRGVTSSGQGVIQLAGWAKHQRIEKPNLNSALPAVSVSSVTRRRKIPDKLRQAIYDRDEGVCQLCGCEVRIGKLDRYDSAPDLAEIDHIEPVVEGGTESLENLRLLCLGCNRRIAGEAVRRRNGEISPTCRGNVGEASVPGSTIVDLGSGSGSGIVDHGSTNGEVDQSREGQPPPPTPEGSPIERLTAYVGPEHRSAIATVAELAGGASRWAQGVMGLYGPSGTEERLMSGVADAERPSVLATALIRYGTDPKARKAWDGKFFRGFVSKAIRERRADREHGGPDFGDETKRDRNRREVAVSRGNRRGAEQRDLEAEKLAAEGVELQAWFDAQPEERKTAIRADAAARLQVIGRVSRVTQLARDAAVITAMREARKLEERTPTGAGT